MLSNTIYNLKVKRKLRIGYFGGSITEGAGSEDREKNCWRALSRDWFKSEYPEAEITEIYAAIGGTGTGFAAFRADTDLIVHKPDLVFIEYAVNDSGNDYDDIARNTESLFRKLRRSLPYADLVLILMTNDEINKIRESGHEFPAGTAQASMAHRYGADIINPGAYAHFKAVSSGRSYGAELTIDGDHPNNEGYRIIAENIIENLKKLLPETIPESPLPYGNLKKPLYDDLVEFGTVIPVDKLENAVLHGFEFGDGSELDHLKKQLGSTVPGSTVSFDFDGTLFGIDWSGVRYNSDISLSVDGGNPEIIKSWDNYVRSFRRFNSAVIYRNLTPGKHHAEIKVLPSDNPSVCFLGIFVLKQ